MIEPSQAGTEGGASPPPSLTRLVVTGTCIASMDELRANVVSACARGLVEFWPYTDSEGYVADSGREAVIVGSSPWLPEHIEEIRAHKARGDAIIAVKGAHNVLVRNGIIPYAAIAVDPQERIRECFEPTDWVTYLIASQCHPAVFDRLKDSKVILWHSSSGAMDGLDDVAGSILVSGGSTSGLRAIYLAYLMGFRRQHLYGFDSCLQGRQVKVTGEMLAEGKQLIDVWVAGRKFVCNAAMAAQASEFTTCLSNLDGVRVTVYGDGLLAAIAREGARLGRKDCIPPMGTETDSMGVPGKPLC